MALWQLEDLEAKLSKEVTLQIFDDANAGVVDPSAIVWLQQDSDSEVLGWIGGIYGVDALVASGDVRLKSLSLRYAEMICTQRHPEYVRRNWKDLYDVWEAEMKNLRAGLTQLARDTAPEPSGNNQARLDSVSAGVGFEPCRVFNRPGGFGY